MFEFERARDLAQLGAEAAMLARLQKARHLHGDGRPAGYDVAARGELHGRARERRHVHAVVSPKGFVFICE